jgi:DnaJ-class molecular chaperone
MNEHIVFHIKEDVMGKILPYILISVCCLLFVNLFSGDFTNVGAGKCKMCHKSEKQGQQYPLWEARKHSQAYAALTTDKAAEIAQGAGIDNPAESEECLKCHGPVAEYREEGVTCEVCHGPGSEYKKMSIMKDHAQAVANGMTEYASPEKIKEKCMSCHENAHDLTFDFDAAWEKVKHPRPAAQ